MGERRLWGLLGAARDSTGRAKPGLGAPKPAQRCTLITGSSSAAEEGLEAGVEVTLLLEPYVGWPGIPLEARLVESVNPAQGASQDGVELL